jgi:pimeloyl-ACP methyl ester carboxylesterase
MSLVKFIGNIMNDSLVKKFCTPPYMDITNFDLKSIDSSEKTYIDFEEIQIPIYSWGKGEKVLLVHGWGSRASHMSLFARIIADAGFNVFTFDAPAHSSIINNPSKELSNMFEFGRSISAVANHLGNLHAVIAHSLGAIATIFTMTGFMKLKGYNFISKKVVLVSSPSSVESIITSFSKRENLTESEKSTLQLGLEKDFDFSVSDYFVSSALKNISIELMVIHDEDDDDVPISNAYDFQKTMPEIVLYFTKGLGHKKILFDRATIKIISNFIEGK